MIQSVGCGRRLYIKEVSWIHIAVNKRVGDARIGEDLMKEFLVEEPFIHF